MMTKQEVVDAVDWSAALSAPRFAGGHHDVMRAMFGDRAKVACEWTEDDYQGQIAFAYEFADGTIAIVTDEFGSCSGCDSWEDATDEEARNMIQQLAINARLFPGRAEAARYCKSDTEDADQWTMRAAKNLAELLIHSSSD